MIYPEYNQNNKRNSLYIVATPIGNLFDITLRAINILNQSDIIICENINNSKKLLSYYGINNKKLLSYNDNSKEEDRNKIVKLFTLSNNYIVSLISDAGTPLISDPGFKLIRLLREKNINIYSVPGPSSLTSALSLSGMACDKFIFLGFLPNNINQISNILDKYKKLNNNIILFESPNKLLKLLKIIKNLFNNINICVIKEITKIYENYTYDNIDYFIQYYESFEKNEEKIKGEFVILLDLKNYIIEYDIYKIIKDELENNKSIANFTKKDLVNFISDKYKSHINFNKKEIYKYILGL